MALASKPVDIVPLHTATIAELGGVLVDPVPLAIKVLLLLALVQPTIHQHVIVDVFLLLNSL